MGQPLLIGSFWLQHAWHFLTGSSEFAIAFDLGTLWQFLSRSPLVYFIREGNATEPISQP